MDEVVVFPEPKDLKRYDGVLTVTGGSRILFGPEESPVLRHAASEVRRALGDLEVRFGVPEGEAGPGDVWLGLGGCRELSGRGKAEGYVLDVRDRITVRAPEEAGLFYGAVTLAQLVRPGGTVPGLRIVDEPDFVRRGIFVENKWGMDLMSLEDWKDVIDVLSRLKLNTLDIGVYGCWCVQYEGQVTEFLTVPLPNYPLLRTEKTIRYYSPSSGWKHLTYLPVLFEEDLLGDIVKYGRERNVLVYPHFNSLGHNTLIPRLYPEVSAKDEEGEPTGYGYCLSEPGTYEMVFSMYGHIIKSYLLPNGVRHFHIGMDEVYPVVGADPRDPKRRVDPWCRCDRCRGRSRDELLLDYVVKLCSYLVEQGIEHISMWHDQFARQGLLEALSERLEEAGLRDKVVLHWWHYGLAPPESIRPELGMRAWMTPMHGYFFWWVYGSYLRNIHDMLKLGASQGAEGAESYGAYDPAFHRELCCLAEYSWRNDAGDLEGFRRKYLRYMFGEASREAEEAMGHLEAVAEHGELHSFLRLLFPYPYTYVNPKKPYPRDYPGEPLRNLLSDVEGSEGKLRTIIGHARAAEEGFSSLKGRARFPEVVDGWEVEALRIRTFAEEFLFLLRAFREYGRAEGLGEELEGLLEAHDHLMAEVERVKKPYLLPQTLRELTTMRRGLARIRRKLLSAAEGEVLPAEEVFFDG